MTKSRCAAEELALTQILARIVKAQEKITEGLVQTFLKKLFTYRSDGKQRFQSKDKELKQTFSYLQKISEIQLCDGPLDLLAYFERHDREARELLLASGGADKLLKQDIAVQFRQINMLDIPAPVALDEKSDLILREKKDMITTLFE